MENLALKFCGVILLCLATVTTAATPATATTGVSSIERQLNSMSCNGAEGSCPLRPELQQLELLATSQFATTQLAELRLADGNVYSVKPGIELYGYQLKQIKPGQIMFSKIGPCCGACCSFTVERSFFKATEPKLTVVPERLNSGGMMMVPPILPNSFK